MSQEYLEWYELPAKRWKSDPKSYWEKDSQRQKLYDAESSAKVWDSDLAKNFSSIEEIQKFVNKLISSAWFKKRFGQTSIAVKSKAGFGADACGKTTGLIRFSLYSRSMLTVLHEVAHIIKKSGAGGSHGRFFARTLLELVEHIVGIEAARMLKKKFKQERVKYLPRRELSAETREKMRQNFINNVLKQKVEV